MVREQGKGRTVVSVGVLAGVGTGVRVEVETGVMTGVMVGLRTEVGVGTRVGYIGTEKG